MITPTPLSAADLDALAGAARLKNPAFAATLRDFLDARALYAATVAARDAGAIDEAAFDEAVFGHALNLRIGGGLDYADFSGADRRTVHDACVAEAFDRIYNRNGLGANDSLLTAEQAYTEAVELVETTKAGVARVAPPVIESAPLADMPAAPAVVPVVAASPVLVVTPAVVPDPAPAAESEAPAAPAPSVTVTVAPHVDVAPAHVSWLRREIEKLMLEFHRLVSRDA